MASNRGRRSARNTPTGTNAMGIQRKINSDYVALARDYRKLGSELLRMPATKYILGGVALSALIPFAWKYFGEGDLSDSISRGVDSLRNRWENRGDVDLLDQ